MTKMTCAAILAAAAVATSASADVITQWNFNSNPADANTGTGTNTPVIGAGSVALVGGATSTYAAGSPGDTSSATDNSGLNVSTWATQGTGDKSRGVAFAASTAGFNSIIVTFDMRWSATVSRNFQLQFTTDGVNFSDVSGGVATGPTTLNTNLAGTFTNAGLLTVTTASSSQTFAQGFSYAFASGSSVENNPNFGVRLVATFDPGQANYISSNAGTTTAYAVTGTARFDLVTINGTVIPTPGSIALIGLGGLIAARRRRA